MPIFLDDPDEDVKLFLDLFRVVFRMVRSGPVLKEKPDRTEKFGPVWSGPKFRTGPNRKFGPVLGPVLRSKFQFLFLKKKNQNYLM